jgi:ABC-2 type transport system permease protein
VNLLSAAIAAEFLKARRSKVPWVITSAFSLAPVVGGLFMVILKDPERARQLGLLGTKAQLTAGTADWPTFLGLLAQSIAVGGGVVFAFLTAWVFGREFADRTIRGLLAIPTPRWAIVVAKTIVVMGWCGASGLWVIVIGFAIGAVIGLPEWSTDAAVSTGVTMLLVGLLIISLRTTTAFFAGAGRGYIPPLAWAMFTIFLAQILSVLGWGGWFPWAVPALLAGAAGPAADYVTPASFWVVALASATGLLATLVWWERADQTG